MIRRTYQYVAVVALLALGYAHPSEAQIAFGSLGASSAGTASISVAVPASISTGDGLGICVASREAPGTVTDWTLVATQSGGSGAAGADTGTVHATFYWKVAVGGETAVSVPVSGGTGGTARMIRYTKTAATWVDPAASKGSDNTAGTAWSVTGDVDQGVTAGDFVVDCTAQNTDLYTNNAQSMSQSGVTFSAHSERIETPTPLGNDSNVYISEHPVSAGTSAGAPTFTMTASGTATDNPAGATVMVRLREAAAGSSSACRGMLLGVGCDF